MEDKINPGTGYPTPEFKSLSLLKEDYLTAFPDLVETEFGS
jgi:hypothetical protein